MVLQDCRMSYTYKHALHFVEWKSCCRFERSSTESLSMCIKSKAWICSNDPPSETKKKPNGIEQHNSKWVCINSSCNISISVSKILNQLWVCFIFVFLNGIISIWMCLFCAGFYCSSSQQLRQLQREMWSTTFEIECQKVRSNKMLSTLFLAFVGWNARLLKFWYVKD